MLWVQRILLRGESGLLHSRQAEPQSPGRQWEKAAGEGGCGAQAGLLRTDAAAGSQAGGS